MGAYLSEPVTEKITSKDENEFFRVAASSMQGWRINQEDAHNCILSFDESGPTAFFAVYDGHGGSEVAEYCSLKLPKFLKETEAYKSGNIEQALKDTFINFDQTLLLPETIAELKDLAKKNPDYQPSDEEDEDEENISDLYQEAKMPLKEVLEKYSKNPRLENLKAGSSTKPLSPCLKSKSSRISDAGGSSSSSTSSAGPSSSTSEAKPVEADDTVSSSSSKELSAKEQESNEPTSSTSTTAKPVELDSTTEKPEKADDEKEKTSKALVNGDVEGSDQITSSSLTENGEVSSNSKPIVEAAGSAGSSSGSSETLPTRAAKINSITSSARAIAMDDDEDSTTDEENDASFKVEKAVEHDDEDDSDDDDDEDTEDGDEDEENFDDMDEEDETDEDDTMTYEDEEFMNNMVDEPGKDSGCTAVAAVLRGRDLWVANAGDSRCIVCRDGKVVEMSFDHKPEDQIEFDRIKNAGGRVSADGRVNGGLNLSRAIGDHGYKTNSALKPEEQMISAQPDIKQITLTDKDEFMVLACDGIWNFMSNEEVVEFVKAGLKQQKSLSDICGELFDNCLAPNTMGDGTGCDNMTAIIVVFKPELYEKIKCETAEAGESLNVTTNGGKKRQVDEEVSGEAESTESVASKRQKIEDDTETAPVSVDTSTT